MSPASGQPAPPASDEVTSPAEPELRKASTDSIAGDKLDNLLTAWALESIPHTFSDTKKWGTQVEKAVRLRLRQDPDGKLETYREKQLFNHGDWSRYSASLIEPEETFRVQVRDIRAEGNGRTRFDIHFAADLALEGRQAKWVRGVQLYSVGATGTAQVRLVVTVSLATQLDLSHLPPDLILDPRVTEAKIHVDDFRLNHVGKFGGEVAQQVTVAARGILDRQIEAKEAQLVEKLNAKIDRSRERLVLSAAHATVWQKRFQSDQRPRQGIAD